MMWKWLGKSHLGEGKLPRGSVDSGEASIRRLGSGVVFCLEVEEDHVESFSGEENGLEELREAW